MQKNKVALAISGSKYESNHISTVSLLVSRFADRPIIPFSEALGAVSIHVPTARNQCSAGTFPIPIIRRGKRLFIELVELGKRQFLHAFYNPIQLGIIQRNLLEVAGWNWMHAKSCGLSI